MSANNPKLQHYDPMMELQNLCSKNEVKRPTPYSIEDLLPTSSRQMSPASSVSSSPNSQASSSSQPSSPQQSESDSSCCDRDSSRSSQRSPPISKKYRTSFSHEQIFELEQLFEKKQYLESSERQQIAASLGMTDQQVKTWFQNRRMKHKRKRTTETQYYTKLAFANRLASGIPPPQPSFHSYQPPFYPSIPQYSSMEPPRYQSFPSEFSAFQHRPSPPFYPGVELSGPASPPPHYPGPRFAHPTLCRECPGPDCGRPSAPLYNYPNMPMFTPPQDYSLFH